MYFAFGYCSITSWQAQPNLQRKGNGEIEMRDDDNIGKPILFSLLLNDFVGR